LSNWWGFNFDSTLGYDGEGPPGHRAVDASVGEQLWVGFVDLLRHVHGIMENLQIEFDRAVTLCTEAVAHAESSEADRRGLEEDLAAARAEHELEASEGDRLREQLEAAERAYEQERLTSEALRKQLQAGDQYEAKRVFGRKVCVLHTVHPAHDRMHL